MTVKSTALVVVALAAATAACATTDRSGAQRTASAPPQTTPSAMEPVMTQTRPVEGGAPTVVDPSTLAPTTTGANTIIAAPASQTAPNVSVGVPVAEVRNPQSLKGVEVKDRAGQSIGEVQAVRLTADGKIAAVTVDTGTRTVALQPARLKYVQAENTVVSDQSKAEIQRQS